MIPTEDIEVKLSNFYTKIKDPVLSNVPLAFSGGDIRTSQIYPNTCPTSLRARCSSLSAATAAKARRR